MQLDIEPVRGPTAVGRLRLVTREDLTVPDLDPADNDFTLGSCCAVMVFWLGARVAAGTTTG